MRSPNNLNPSLKNDRRVEVLLKQEMAEHQAVISSHHKEMQELRDALSLAMSRFDSLYEHSQSEIKDMALGFNQLFVSLKEKMAANEMLIADQKQTILSLHHQLNGLHLLYANVNDIQKFRKDLEFRLDDSTKGHIQSSQNLQNEMKEALRNIVEQFSTLKDYFVEKVCRIDDEVQHKFLACKVDKDGILKNIRIYEKAMFIIEKKIENIYTLIDRINKREETCHKPA